MPSFFDGAPVVKKLLIINCVIFLLGIFMNTDRNAHLTPLEEWGAFSIENGLQVWRLITFQFLHAGFGHLFANALGLFFFGPHIERWLGSRPFLLFYLLCGIAGVLFYVLLFFSPGLLAGYSPESPMVGASAGIFGILAAFMVIAPEAKIYLFLVIPMKMRTFGILFFCYETAGVLFNWHNAGGSAGHLGGAFLGMYFAKNVGASDRILDKISENGIQSLTKEERNILDKARKQ